jgi:hypothetical protein
MHEVHVAGITFGIERPLYDERAFVVPLDEASTTDLRRVPVC